VPGIIDEGYFEFDQKDNGQFHFGYVHGQMDCRPGDCHRAAGPSDAEEGTS